MLEVMPVKSGLRSYGGLRFANSDLRFSSKDFNFLSMEDSEKNRYIEFLIQQKEERERTIADKDVFIKNLQETLDMLKSMHESDSKKIDDLMASHEQDSLKIDQMLAQINDLTAQLKLKNKQTFADKSQKGISKKGMSNGRFQGKNLSDDECRY